MVAQPGSPPAKINFPCYTSLSSVYLCYSLINFIFYYCILLFMYVWRTLLFIYVNYSQYTFYKQVKERNYKISFQQKLRFKSNASQHILPMISYDIKLLHRLCFRLISLYWLRRTFLDWLSLRSSSFVNFWLVWQQKTTFRFSQRVF